METKAELMELHIMETKEVDMSVPLQALFDDFITFISKIDE